MDVGLWMVYACCAKSQNMSDLYNYMHAIDCKPATVALLRFACFKIARSAFCCMLGKNNTLCNTARKQEFSAINSKTLIQICVNCVWIKCVNKPFCSYNCRAQYCDSRESCGRPSG